MKSSTELKTLCNVNRYDAVAMQSLKYENGEYLRITKDDITGPSPKSVAYLAIAKNLCSTFDTSRKVEKKMISDTEWEYRYYAGILFDSSHTYRIRFFEDSWRFVLPSGGRI